MRLTTALLAICAAPFALRAQDVKAINPRVMEVVNAVSEERIGETLNQLESFGTRNIFSSQDDPEHGIGAARKWIYEQFRSYSPRLEVSYDTYQVKKNKGRIVRDVELQNVVAVLPGTVNKDHHIIISGHYDSAVIARRPENATSTDGAASSGVGQPPIEPISFDLESKAPGANDDGSGTAAVLEMARVMSRYEWKNTVVFIAFTAEEEGLVGSTLYARRVHKENQVVDAVLNNDIIGGDVGGSGRKNNTSVALYSEEPADSLSRELARYVKQVCERYVPSMRVDLVFRQDRLGRGGDHSPFNQEGYAAVRFTAPEENYANQHSVTDTVANMSIPYTARAARVNAAALANLALAPKKPVVEEQVVRQGKPVTVTMLTRGKTRYDAQLRWKNENPEPDLAGYAIVERPTTSPFWEQEIFVGNVTEYLMKDVSIDDRIFGVKAIDKNGNASLVSVYVPRPRPPLEIETY
jgi:acetylornithine deacetylase/succinyl-diaminopimelate desuccinylase-like protein